ncbi:hypothetical protein [Agrococcus sp. HG114]|uniref:hypothetical protein n=1 Tax=Agrococcus sp. HG114 TaxID=2969757 RepID=UPI00215AA173|nr:hypothetical protein [Agrococcus sp. HG114]MCR8669624.1 hypothetical protein [Agrococcus sp. HG114]
MIRRLGSAAALASVAALVLVGCSPPQQTPGSTPAERTPSPDSVDIEQEARQGWDRYQERLAELGADPASADIDALRDVAEPAHAEFLADNFREAADRRIHTEGKRETTEFAVVDASAAPERVEAAACVDLTGERVIGDEGLEIVDSERPALEAVSVTLVTRASERGFFVESVTAFDDSAAADPCA